MGFLFFLISLQVHAQVYFEQPQVQSIKLPQNVEFKLISQEYKVHYKPGDISEDPAGGDSFGTRMFAEYKVPAVKQLEDYAIVQFIRGCQFTSQIESAKVSYYDNILVRSFDRLIPYKLPKLMVDSVDQDPMYNNTPQEDLQNWGTRHGLYRWNKMDGSFDQDGEILYYEKKPSTPRLYVVDHPGTAFFQNKIAKNISLQFQTCLFRTSDVPEKSDAFGVGTQKALHCFGWQSSYIYNFESQKFDHLKEIHPHCLSR